MLIQCRHDIMTKIESMSLRSNLKTSIRYLFVAISRADIESTSNKDVETTSR